MHDGLRVLLWSAVFAGGLGVCLWLSRRGLARTYVRDLLHVGAGVWPLGWWAWQSPWPPIVVATTGFVLLIAVPLLARRFAAAGKLERAVSGEGEAWTGLVLYAFSAAVFTAVGLLGHAPFPPRRRCSRWRSATGSAVSSGGCGDATGSASPGRRRRASRARRWWPPSRRSGRRWPDFSTVCRSRRAGSSERASRLRWRKRVAPRATDNVLVPLAVWLVAGGLESGGPP